MTTSVRFNNRSNTDFLRDLRKNVNDYFESKGIRKYATPGMKLKTIILFIVTYGSYAMIMTGLFSPFAMLGLCVIMGIGTAGMGFSIGHDALHGAYSSKGWVNKFLGLSFNLIGASDYIWKIKHNVNHHTYTNIYSKHEDISVTPALRFSEHAPHKRFHKIQPFFVFFAYGVLTLNWTFAFDFMRIIKYRNHTEQRIPPLQVWKIAGTKLFYYAYMLVLPMIFLAVPWWSITLGFILMHFVASVILSFVFQLAHVVEETSQFAVPEKGTSMEHAWAVHQMHTTSNFAMKSRFLTWYVGGLNFQIEHHLFPNICSVHYPALSPIVQETAAQYSIPYNNYRTLTGAIGSHLRVLKTLSKPHGMEISG